MNGGRPRDPAGQLAKALARRRAHLLVDCAVRLYLDVLSRLDGERSGPVDVLGFRT